ncbi:MAG TPA: thiamine phosphate synthase [Myxococcaceae bacterium]|nr:thiamine phosphate synthase [Myxococcaceae bacterium]
MKDVPGFPKGLYAICDDAVRPELTLEEKAGLLLAGGVRVMQLRMKRTAAAAALAAARQVARMCRGAHAICIIDDRVDYALMSGADGVHLGDDDLPASQVRRLLGPHKLVGVTVRNLAMAGAAQEAGADYVGVGPVFASGTKFVGVEPLGIEGLRAVARGSTLPVVAISGINLSNVGRIAGAGAHGAAVLSDLLGATDIPARARALAGEFARALGR